MTFYITNGGNGQTRAIPLVTVRKASQRPLVEGDYNAEALRPTFSGYHNKFTVLLPISERVIGEGGKGRKVFSNDDIDELEKLFVDTFGGFTRSSRKHPLLEGNWTNDLTKKTITNKHALYEIYTQQSTEAIAYFRDLKRGLHRRAKARGMGQDIIVIEQTEVTFISEPVKLRT